MPPGALEAPTTDPIRAGRQKAIDQTLSTALAEGTQQIAFPWPPNRIKLDPFQPQVRPANRPTAKELPTCLRAAPNLVSFSLPIRRQRLLDRPSKTMNRSAVLIILIRFINCSKQLMANSSGEHFQRINTFRQQMEAISGAFHSLAPSDTPTCCSPDDGPQSRLTRTTTNRFVGALQFRSAWDPRVGHALESATSCCCHLFRGPARRRSRSMQNIPRLDPAPRRLLGPIDQVDGPAGGR